MSLASSYLGPVGGSQLGAGPRSRMPKWHNYFKVELLGYNNKTEFKFNFNV